MAPGMESFHHRPTTKVNNKPFKSRHATKGAIKDRIKGKVEDWKRERRTPHQQLMSKFDRRNQARQKQALKHREKAKANSIFNGRQGAPRHVAVVPLSDDVDARAAIRQLNSGVEADTEVPVEGVVRVRVDRFKQNVIYIPTKCDDLFGSLEACRVADYVIFVLSSTTEVSEQGELLLRSIEGQGVSNVLATVQNLEMIYPPKKRSLVLSSLRSFITHFFPSLDKVYSLDLLQECSNIMRSLCSTTPRGIKWREDRSWMLIEEVQWPADANGDEKEVIVTGVVRGKGLKADRLVQVGDWGDFQISKIVARPLSGLASKSSKDAMVMDDDHNEEILEEPTDDQDNLAELAPEDIMIDEPEADRPYEAKKGVLLDDYHYFSDDDDSTDNALPRPKRLPKGTSSYQAAWILDDVSDSDSDEEQSQDADGDVSMDGGARPEDGIEGLTAPTEAMTEAAPSEYPQSEMFDDPSPEDEVAQIEEYRRQRKEAEEDLEFPDEIELHPGVLARERLARYRGLKSLRTSTWETDEDRAFEPEGWRRLLQIGDYKGARNRAIHEALVGGVKPGTRVSVYLQAVPTSFRQAPQPLTLVSHLRHEHKRTVANYTIILNSDAESPIKSKIPLLMQCGSRRLLINPLFSQPGATPNDVHKFDRYLHPGQTAIATFIGPVIWGAVPALFFDPKSYKLVATGTSQPPSVDRVVAKRVILTGHPFKINKKVVTVRYMFFNKEDINWFKALPLWTRRGRSGFVKESLGTHGYFKATFDGKINPMDAVGISLYKRVFPRWSSEWRPSLEACPELVIS